MLFDSPSPAWQGLWPVAATQRMARAGLLTGGEVLFLSIHLHTPVILAILIPNASDATQGLTSSGE